MCLCSFGAAAVLQNYDPAKSQVRSFTFTPGKGLSISKLEEAPSEARQTGNRFEVQWVGADTVSSAATDALVTTPISD